MDPFGGAIKATLPALKQMFRLLDVEEADVLAACDATFKLGIKFVDWLRAPRQDSRTHCAARPKNGKVRRVSSAHQGPTTPHAIPYLA